MIRKLLIAAGSIALMTAATFSGANAADPENTIILQLSTGGPVKIELRNDVAPQHAARIKELARAGFYDNQIFHRVIEGFMAQTGDPTGTGTSGSDKPDLPAEFSQTDYVRGTVGMARKSDPNSANSQFFICFDDTGCSSLKGQYTVIGQVTGGMEFVDKIARGEPPASPDKIVSMKVEADAAGAAASSGAAPAPAGAPEAPAATEPAAQ
ncbi:MAG: peptidylprolyl isomerase [Alphaproteobacteria bacterium]|nr:peptidylprolyl isomerase [Alphaproteobacteria bacterium]